MFKFILLLVIAAILYTVIRFFVKNKDARKALVDQAKNDAEKLGNSVKKKADEVKGKI